MPSSSSSSSHTLSIDRIIEILKKKEFRFEKLFSEDRDIKYIIFRHVSKGFQFALYISSKYTVELIHKYEGVNISLIHEEDLDENSTNEYELLLGNYLDNTYNSLSLNASVAQLNFKRFMRSVSFNKNYGLLFLTQYSFNHITYNRVRKYKPASSFSKHINVIPVLSIEELINWTTLTHQTLETMIEKLWTLLTDINVRHASTIISLKDSLNTLETSKIKYDVKNIELKTEYKKIQNQISDISSNIAKLKAERNSVNADNVLKKQAIEEKISEFEKQRRILFSKKTDLEIEINTYHIFMDEIIYRSNVCLTQLNNLIQSISNIS